MVALVAVTAGPAAAADRKAPTQPTNLRVTDKTTTSISVAWDRSTDNVGVLGYELFKSSKRVAKTNNLSYTFGSLKCGTSYKLAVDAFDAAGNRSRKTSFTRLTEACPITAPPTNTALPTVSGVAVDGQTLTAATGSWSGSPTAYVRQWVRCDAGGAGCNDVAGATGTTYVLATTDVGSTIRVRITATNAMGSTSATSAQTAVVDSPPAPGSFPASFFTGPLGMANILPGRSPGVLLGAFADGSWDSQKNQWLSRESFLGRQFDLYGLHYAAPNDTCDYGGTVAPYTGGREAWVVNHGGIPVISWTHGWTIAAVNAGSADACIRAVARRAAAFGHRHLLRMYWEFNGDWMRWSGSGQPFIDAWRRTVNLFRAEGATNVGFVWSPDGGYRDKAFASYPGDEWVDWVGMSLYNMNKAGTWCGATNSGPWCEMGYVLSYDPVKYPTIYDRYSTRKPFILGESASVEDPLVAGRKGQWFRNARSEISSRLQNLRGFTYFDIDLTQSENFNWRLDTSQSSLDGFRELARDPFFNTRS